MGSRTKTDNDEAAEDILRRELGPPRKQWLEHCRKVHGEAFVDELAHKLKHSTCSWQPRFETKRS